MQNVRRRVVSTMIAGAVGIMLAAGLLFPAAAKAAQTTDTEPAFTEVETVSGDTVEIDLSEEFPQSGDELLLQYFEEKSKPAQTASAKKGVRTAAPRSSRLSGNNLVCYQYLKEQIALIAAGQLSSARIEVPVSLMVNGEELLEYISEEDLGVEGHCFDFVNGKAVQNDEVMAAALALMYERFEIDFTTLVYSLMADCPYEFYWQKRSFGMSFPGVTFGTLGESIYLKFKPEAQLTFVFMVGSEYRAEGGDEYTLDTATTSAASAAAANVQTIVAEFASEPDYYKLVNYKNRICDLVSYNDNAAAYVNNENYPYTDPWQLIYVFDGDSSTNVVCEGYAKAFKYLCDCSDFMFDIECITARGTLTVNGDGGGHMWNIVKMEDGENYLVDVTNCDTGTIGAPAKLFMQGYDSILLDSEHREVGFTVDCGYATARYQYREIMFDLYDNVRDLMLSKTDYEYHEIVLPTFEEVALVLNGNIGVVFSVDIPSGFNGNGSEMEFVVSDGVAGHTGRTVKVPYSESVPVANSTKRCFTVEISPLEIADTITATFKLGNGANTSTAYQATTYIAYVQENMTQNTELLNLVNGLYTYCYYLQFYGWDSNQYTHRAVAAPAQNSMLLSAGDVQAAKEALSGYVFTNELAGSGIEDASISLTLNGRTDINVYVKPDNTAEITTGGGVERTIGTATYYRFKTLPIGPKNLGDEYTITVETNQGTATITGSALAYAGSVLNNGAVAQAKQYAMTAFYRYYLAALAYTE